MHPGPLGPADHVTASPLVECSVEAPTAGRSVSRPLLRPLGHAPPVRTAFGRSAALDLRGKDAEKGVEDHRRVIGG